jgi:hypothetical protein
LRVPALEMINHNLPHLADGDRPEMSRAGPVRVPMRGKVKVGFVDDFGRREGETGWLPLEITLGNRSQLGVNELHELLGAVFALHGTSTLKASHSTDPTI